MLKEKKAIILVLMDIAIFYMLISPRILPTVLLSVRDACIITAIIAIVTLFMRYLSKVEMANLEKKLERQHSQLTAIINNSPFIVFLKSVDGKIILANEVLANLFSASREQLVGRNSYEFVSNPENCMEEDKHLLATKEIITCERYESLINGRGHWFRIVKVPVLDENDDISSIVVIFRIIDDVKELEERKNTFIATLTHDLDEQKEMLEQIKSSCKYMYDLIFTILDTYLYDNGLTKINAEKFDILALLNETTRSMSNLLRERNQKLIINTNLTSNIVIADKVQIKRVIINLLANAVKHGFKNSDIEVFVTENDENIKMEVKNKSEYINKEQMKEIFEKYKHSRNAKSIKTSTGLGLYLSKQIIDAHNGQVYAHSDENKNCTFGFEIPKKLVSNPTNKQEIH